MRAVFRHIQVLVVATAGLSGHCQRSVPKLTDLSLVLRAVLARTDDAFALGIQLPRDGRLLPLVLADKFGAAQHSGRFHV